MFTGKSFNAFNIALTNPNVNKFFTKMLNIFSYLV